MELSPGAALAFALPALPICIWVAWSDMARMKIPNAAVIALAASFALIGPFVLPLEDWAWRWTHLAAVLLAGFCLNLAGALGAGDAKFAAAAAPFVAPQDIPAVMVLFAAVLLTAFATHRAARAVPAIRARSPHWESWKRKDFPMGLALGGTLAFYLLRAAMPGMFGGTIS
ncbi:prepilin peptidase [Profundibacterium mesophilum]|uniref:Components of type IV pilus prepilin peptidase n=1 Tax=Profundibacterium mesophilum KAUST100406-0324 TaxID=1037889 RepID=A0A921TD73_9RHOB|nr:prepilin peptidase [Profundibacterium mesophilum]KAF0675822.1 Components of type IV pilus prepilin peptidase [Profundibacterium mesophilum KAUST100406-0324]